MASWLRQLLTYGVALLLAVLLIGWILQHGGPNPSATAAAAGASAGGLFDTLQTNLAHPLSRLFVQLLVIIAAARLAGAAFVRLGLPSVVGETTAGILLSPSLLAQTSPQAFAFIFAADSPGALRLFSQIGICLFMTGPLLTLLQRAGCGARLTA